MQTEEQQVEQLKEWWSENGTALIVGAILGLSGFFGWKYWNEKQIAYQESASQLYMTVTEELEKENSSKLIENATAVKSRFADSSYAILSAFHIAKAAIKENDLDAAVTEFTWVIDNHGGNELVQIAKLRLARIFVAQHNAEQALGLLSLPKESGYFEFASLIKGDALMSLGRESEALVAYKEAESVNKTTANHPTLKLRIESLDAGIAEQEEDKIETDETETEIETETEKTETVEVSK